MATLRGQKCAYCGIRASTRQGDHVLCRSFVLEEHRANLPKVPCCDVCNSRKAKLEQKLASILPLGSTLDDALLHFPKLSRRLEQNQKLAAHLKEGAKNVWHPREYTRTSGFPLDGEGLLNLGNLISRGLLYFYFRQRVTFLSQDRSFFLTPAEDALFWARTFGSHQGERRSDSLGGGVLRFDGLFGRKAPLVSFWRLSFFGGMIVADHNEADGTLEWGNVHWTIIAPSPSNHSVF